MQATPTQANEVIDETVACYFCPTSALLCNKVATGQSKSSIDAPMQPALLAMPVARLLQALTGARE